MHAKAKSAEKRCSVKEKLDLQAGKIIPAFLPFHKNVQQISLSGLDTTNIYSPHSYNVPNYLEQGGGNVHDYIKERTNKIGRCIVETKQTVRTIAKEFGVSKSTVHKDLTERLPEINPELADQVKHILEYHKSIRHLRGGEATKIKYKKTNEKKQKEVIAASKK